MQNTKIVFYIVKSKVEKEVKDDGVFFSFIHNKKLINEGNEVTPNLYKKDT